MGSWSVLIVLLCYLALLFALAFWAERNTANRWIKNPYVYALSLAVYCSAWNYYGSVGVAANSGIDFLTIYLGPVIALPLWMFIMTRIIKIAKNNKIASIADFVSLRYGNDRQLGALIAIICIFGIVPYISLQLKAVSETFQLLSGSTQTADNIFSDTTFYISLLLAVFIAFFGTLATDASRSRRGLITTVAFESIIKLVFFLVIGSYVCFALFDSPKDIYNQAALLEGFESLVTFKGLNHGISWFYTIMLSFLAIFLLPRQFHVAVVENEDPKYIKKAIWFFSLYLLLFNIFVFYIAFAGKLSLGTGVNPDYYSLLLPLAEGNTGLALMVFIGGFSAVISMVVVSTLALSTMVSNNLLIPYGLLDRLFQTNPETNTRYIRNVRRVSIFVLVVTAYLFYYYFSSQLSLFSLGLIAFVIIAQLAPSFFLGLFWNRGTATASKIGMIAGFAVVVFTLILPRTTLGLGSNTDFITEGYFGISALKPFGLFGMDMLSAEAHALFWSLLVNLSLYGLFSLLIVANYRERNFGELFVHVNSVIGNDEQGYVWRGEAYVEDVKKVLNRFLGNEKTEKEFQQFYKRNGIDPNNQKADARLINFSEKLLTGTLGSVSARMLIGNVAKEHPISLQEVLNILEDTKTTRATNKILTQKSKELSQLAGQLQSANDELVQQDRLKDEFLDTVAHELKTPITSIKAAAEVLVDDEGDMPYEFKENFLKNIQEDADRLQTLIGNILDLEKLSNGRQELQLEHRSVRDTIQKAVRGIHQLAEKKGVQIITSEISDTMAYYDEDRVGQVLTNLLSNALKFTEAKRGKVQLRAQNEAEQVKVIVEDNGRGIAEEDFQYIFEKFYQSKYQNTRKPQGSGFGLAICKKIIESHKGNIWADPDFSEGARFVFTLPTHPN